MRSRDPRFRHLDPVDPRAHEPDAEALLREILGPCIPPREAARNRRRRLQVGLGVASTAALASVVVGMSEGTRGDVVAQAYAAVHQPDTVLHYTRRTLLPGGNAPQQYYDEEVWQAGDGSRQRVLLRSHGTDNVNEEVIDGTRSLTYNSAENVIVVYDEKAPKPDAAAGARAGAVGDPRTLLERARSGDAAVKELGETRVRGIDVLQFRVGTCEIREHPGTAGAGVGRDLRPAYVVSISEDDHLPVRIEPVCPPQDRPAHLRDADNLWPGGFVTDYLQFEVLPANAATERQLEMAPHPGARTVDGEDIDAAEERAESHGDLPPTPTPEARP